MGWAVETVAAVEAEIKALPAKLMRAVGPSAGDGREHRPGGTSGILNGKLWELRVRAEEGHAKSNSGSFLEAGKLP